MLKNPARDRCHASAAKDTQLLFPLFLEIAGESIFAFASANPPEADILGLDITGVPKAFGTFA